MLKKLSALSNWNHHLAALLLRLGFGMGMMSHGLSKLQRYDKLSSSFADYFGIGSEITLILVIFAELICAGFVVLGVFSRLASIPVIFTMMVAFFVTHSQDAFDRKEKAFVYLVGFLVIFIVGSGKYSVDKLISQKS